VSSKSEERLLRRGLLCFSKSTTRYTNAYELRNNLGRKTARFEGMAYGNILFYDYFCAVSAQKQS
jgi:hypothetical protein